MKASISCDHILTGKTCLNHKDNLQAHYCSHCMEPVFKTGLSLHAPSSTLCDHCVQTKLKSQMAWLDKKLVYASTKVNSPGELSPGLLTLVKSSVLNCIEFFPSKRVSTHSVKISIHFIGCRSKIIVLHPSWTLPQQQFSVLCWILIYGPYATQHGCPSRVRLILEDHIRKTTYRTRAIISRDLYFFSCPVFHCG